MKVLENLKLGGIYDKGRVITGISQIRLIMTLRYVQGLTWRQVDFRIGGGNTEDGVKKRVYRYLGNRYNY